MKIITAKDFGELIRSTRKKARLTQSQLAAACGVGGTIYQRAGKREAYLPIG